MAVLGVSSSPSSTWETKEASKRAQPAPDLEALIQQLQNLSLDVDYWRLNANRVASDDPQQQLLGAHQFRLILSLAGEIPIQSVIDTGVIPLLAAALTRTDNCDLQFEAAWALTNVASGTTAQTQTVVDAGAIPRLAELLAHPREDIREQGMWCLGNIAGDRACFRDCVLAVPDIIPRFVHACACSAKTSTLRTGVWALSNLCRGKPRAPLELIRGMVPYLVSVIAHPSLRDADTLSDACWALDGVSECQPGTALVAASGAVPHLVRLLGHRSLAVQRPALRVTGQLVTGGHEDTQMVIQHGGLLALAQLLTSERRCLRKDTCWAMSNLAAGTASQLQSLLDSGVVPTLLHLLDRDPELDVRREAAWTICNVCTTQVPRQMEYLVRAGCVRGVVQSLLLADEKMADVALEAITNFVKFLDGGKKGLGVEMLKQQGLLMNLVTLQEQAQRVGSFELWDKIHKFVQELAGGANGDNNNYHVIAGDVYSREGGDPADPYIIVPDFSYCGGFSSSGKCDMD